MTDQDGSYAPQSPDFSAYPSSFQSEPPVGAYFPPQQQAAYQPAPYNPAPYDAHRPSEVYSSSRMPKNNGQVQGYGHKADLDWMPESSSGQGSGRKAKKQRVEAACDKPAPGVEEGIEVKTKFPVARIKRIMQADEDVGKVAQVTPTAVSKALELFMISLVTKAAEEAKEKQSKRVTAGHLKQACERDEQWDFLTSIMDKVPETSATKKDEDSEEAGDGKKKKGGMRRRKRESEEF